MQQVKIGLTDKQRGALEAAAKKNGRTLSEEVRLRLESSLLDDELSDFARVAGREVSMIVQIVTLSAAADEKASGDLSSDEGRARIRSVMWRATVVAVNDYFAEIKPRHFSASPIVPPPTEPNIKADAIGHAAAQALFVWALGGTVPTDSPASWLFSIGKSGEKP